MSRVLVVQTAHLGDIVLTTPLLRALSRAGSAHVTVLTTAAGASLLAGQPGVNETLRWAKRDGRGAGASTAGVLRALWRGRFDVAVAAQRSIRSGLFLLATRARLRVGFAGAPGSAAYTCRVPWDPARHAAERYLDLAGPAGAAHEGDAQPRLEVAETAVGRARELLARAGLPGDAVYACLAPGAAWGTKRWTPEGFAALARHCAARGVAPVLVGGAGERVLCEEVVERAQGVGTVLAGQTDLPTLAALLRGARAMLANDSGPAHVAAAVGTPVVTIFGPTVPAFGYVPWGNDARVIEKAGLDCRPCHRHGPHVCPLGHFRCMREIDPCRVAQCLDDAIEARTRRVGDCHI